MRRSEEMSTNQSEATKKKKFKPSSYFSDEEELSD